MNLRRILEKIVSMKAKSRRTYISQASKTSCEKLFIKGVKPKAVLEQLIGKIPTLTIEQVRRQYNAFNRNKRSGKAIEPTITLKDLVGTSNQDVYGPVDTKGSEFLAQAMSSKQPIGFEQLDALKELLVEKAELLAELSAIYSKASIALETVCMIDGWEQGKTGSGSVWKQVEDFLRYLRDEQVAKLT